jgi:NADH dehydrogenase
VTVLVNGASGVVGHAAVRALLALDEVRATVRRPEAAAPLRALGAKVAIRELDRADAIGEVVPRCHTVIHLVGGPNQADPDALFRANHGSVLAALEAAREAGVRRFVLVSVPGAAPDAAHPFLRAKGLAEEAVAASGLDHAILRCSHVYGVGGLWFTAAVQGALASPPFVAGAGDQIVAPVLADDVAAVLAAIDDHAGALGSVWALEGPDALTADGFCALLRDDEAVPGHADGQAAARLLSSLLGIPVDAVAASYLASASRADAPDASAAFGIARTPLERGLRQILEAAAVVPPG